MILDTAVWVLVLLPAGAAGWLLLGRPGPRVAATASVLTAAVTLALAVPIALSRPEVSTPFVAGADLGFGVDALAGVTLITVTAVTLLVLLAASADIEEAAARFHGLMLLFAASVNATVMADTLPTLLLAWELMGATSYALIGFWWREEARVAAGLTAFLTTRAADLGLYVAAAGALAAGTRLTFAELPSLEGAALHVVTAGVLVAALGKAAQLPFSFWISGAMQGPSSVSALLHSAAMVAMGGYLLLRLEPLLAASSWAPSVTAWVGVATAVVLGAVALGQRDLKQLLAASTAAQLGFVVLAAGVGAVAGGAAQLVAHASTKALLFLAAGAWLTALGSKQLRELRGAARWDRVLGWSATVGALSLAGVAPLSLWATKDAVLAGALAMSAALYGAGLLAAALSAGYAAKILWMLWAPTNGEAVAAVSEDTPVRGARRSRLAVGVLAIGAALLGVLVVPPLGEAWASALGSAAPHPTVVELLVSAGLALAVVLVVRRVEVPEPRWALTWLGLERLTTALVADPVLGLARASARFDDRFVDGAVDGAGRGTLRIADRLAQVDVVRIDGLVESLARGVRGLGSLARRPQTGQLHQYYLQALLLLAVGVVVVVVVR